MYTWRDIRTTPDLRALENVRERTGYAIQSQYSASPRILALAAGFQEHIDPHVDVDLFYSKMFDIYTAEGVGLDNWGVILGIGRTIPGLPGSPGSVDGGAAAITLEDAPYRLLLLYKAMANISAATADAQNALLATLIATGIGGFPRVAYVLEVDAMVIRWVFEDFLDPVQLAVFMAAGTLARGAGVGWELYAIDPLNVFGFDGSQLQPFNQASFAPDDALRQRRN